MINMGAIMTGRAPTFSIKKDVEFDNRCSGGRFLHLKTSKIVVKKAPANNGPLVQKMLDM